MVTCRHCAAATAASLRNLAAGSPSYAFMCLQFHASLSLALPSALPCAAWYAAESVLLIVLDVEACPATLISWI